MAFINISGKNIYIDITARTIKTVCFIFTAALVQVAWISIIKHSPLGNIVML